MNDGYTLSNVRWYNSKGIEVKTPDVFNDNDSYTVKMNSKTQQE